METSPESSSPRTINVFYEEAHGSGFGPSTLWRRRRYYLVIFAIAFSSAAEEVEYTAMGTVVSDQRFRQCFLADNYELGAQLFVALSVGSLTGNLLGGRLMDHVHVGRWWTFVTGLLLDILSSVGSALSLSFRWLWLWRLVAGLGASLSYNGGSVLLLELFPSSCRGRYAVVADVFWALGGIYTSLMAMWLIQETATTNNDNNNDDNDIPDTFANAESAESACSTRMTSVAGWRAYFLATAAPSLVGLVLALWLVPESPRYLASTGRYGQAVAGANYLATALRGGIRATRSRDDDQDDDDELQDDCTSTGAAVPYQPLQLEEVQHHFPPQQQQQRDNEVTCQSLLQGYLDMFRGSVQLRRTLLALMVLRTLIIFPGALSSPWHLTILRDHTSPWLANNVYKLGIWFSCLGLVAKVFNLVYIDRISRRVLFCGGHLVGAACGAVIAMAVASLATTTKDGDDSNNKHNNNQAVSMGLATILLVVASSVGTIVGTVSGTVNGLWTTELLPTAQRGTGLSLIGTCFEVAYLVTDTVSGTLMDANQVVLLLALAALGGAVVGVLPILVTSAVLPNTQGVDLVDQDHVDDDVDDTTISIRQDAEDAAPNDNSLGSSLELPPMAIPTRSID